AAADVHAAYAGAIDRAPDAGLEVRARLLAELEFARWLVHGDSMHRPDIVDDAAALLDALAEGLRTDDLSIIDARTAGVDSALDALDRVPRGAVTEVDTSMHTDAYNPEELWIEVPEESDSAQTDTESVEPLRTVGTDRDHDDSAHRTEMLNVETEDLSEARSIFAGTHSADVGEATRPAATNAAAAYDEDDSDEAQRAARAALQRWKSSSSE
ncbi:hypothetical protein ABY45_06225, partial [Microbacterium maritypicum]